MRKAQISPRQNGPVDDHMRAPDGLMAGHELGLGGYPGQFVGIDVRLGHAAHEAPRGRTSKIRVVDLLADNLVPLLLGFWLLVVVAGLIFVVVTAFRLWRMVKRTKGRLEGPLAQLSASAQEARDRVTVLEGHQREITGTGEALNVQLAGAVAAGKHAGDVFKTLRFPVRFLAGL